ncbi:Hint domain-containing protein [Acetobacter sp.]|uniref:Hint domain-containing protein n=1 Tax=Acetobacter sp. TaxID=440 RepID=UPI0039E88B99
MTSSILSSSESAVSVASGDTLTVEAGGVLEGGIVKAGGTLLVSASGDAEGVVISSGGTVKIYSGGSIESAQATDGGKLTVYAGGTTSESVGALVLSSGGVSISATTTAGTTIYVYKGAIASDTVIQGTSGIVRVSSGGEALDTTVKSGSYLWVSSGGYVSGVDVITSGGYVGISAGGTASNVTINGGSGRISGYGEDYSLTNSAYLWISSGGVLSNAVFDSGAYAMMSNGAIIREATVLDGATLYVSAGAATSNVTVSAGGTQQVAGSTFGAVLASGGIDVLTSGAQGSGDTIESGGLEIVSAGASVSGEIVSSGGELVLVAGAEASGLVSAGGEIIWAGAILESAGAFVSAVSLDDGASDSLSVASNTSLDVFSGMVLTSAQDAGVITLEAGAEANGTVVSSGAELDVHGVTSATVVQSGGVEFVEQDGVSVDGTVQTGGVESVIGQVSGLVVESGASLNVSAGGVAEGNTLSAGAVEMIWSGGSAHNETLESGATLVVMSGASTSDMTLEEGAKIISATVVATSNGGVIDAAASVLSRAYIGSGGELTVYASGDAQDITLDDNASATVLSGGVVTNIQGGTLTIMSGGLWTGGSEMTGYSHVSSGGEVSGVAIGSSAALRIWDGGLGEDLTVLDGGNIWEHTGGVLSNIVLEDNGYLGVSAGASAFNVAIHGGSGRISGYGSNYDVDSGGYVIISAGGVLDGGSFSGSASANMSSGGTILNVSVSDGAVLNVVTGAVTSGVHVESGGIQKINGTTVSGVVESGGINILSAGAHASGDVIETGGIEVVSSGASVTGEILSSGGTLLVLEGAEVSGTVSAGGNVVSAGVFLTSGVIVTSAAAGTMSGVTLDTVAESAVVMTGGELDGATLVSGGNLSIQSGGVASSTQDGSLVTVSAGGTASGTVVEGYYATQDVFGSASDTVIGSGGTEIIETGAAVSGSVVQSGGTEKVSGTAAGVVTSAGGITEILAGGSGQGDTVASGGFEIVASGATVSGETVEDGGTLILQDGASVSDITFADGGQIVSAGVMILSDDRVVSAVANIASGLDLEDYSETAEVMAGGALTSSTIGAGATLFVSSGAVALANVVAGDEEVLSGAVAAATLVSGYDAVEVVRDGGAASATQIVADGSQIVSSGGAALDAVVGADGTQIVYGAASGTDIQSGGSAQVYGVMTGSVVEDGGILDVLTSGVAVGNTLASGAMEIVSSGAVASGETVASGATLVVLDGGSAEDIVNDGGTVVTSGMVIWSGTTIVSAVSGLASGVVLDSAHTSATLQSGGEAKGTLVKTDSIFTVASGAAAVSDVVLGLEDVASGGVTELTLLLNGSQTVEGIASATVVGLGGQQIVETGGEADGTVVIAGGQVAVSGILSAAHEKTGGVVTVASGGVAIGDIISSGGIEIVSAGGSASEETVESGGTLIVLNGASVSGTVDSGGAVVSSGEVFFNSAGLPVSATNAPLSGAVLEGEGSSALVLSGGGLVSATVGSDTTLEVASGGIVAGTVVSGTLTLDNGAGASATALLDGGMETIGSSAMDAFAVIGEDGFQNVVEGGVAVSAHVLSDGTQSVYGTATGTVIEGGSQYVYGTADSTVIGEGGKQYIAAGSMSATVAAANAGLTAGGGGGAGDAGYATNVDIQSGGLQIVGGATSGVVVEAGGSQTVGSMGGAVSETISGSVTVSSGGYVQDVTLASGGLLTLANGASADDVRLLSGGMIDLSDLVFGSDVSVSLTDGSQLTVAGADSTVSIDLDGAYDVSQFALSADAAGATLLTIAQDGTPCYGRGTLIRTDRGEVPVEQLSIGDRVMTAENGACSIRWIGRRAYSGQFAHGNRDVLPVIFRKGSLGNNLPHSDLSVSPLHAMMLDGLLVPAVTLVNGVSVLQAERMDEVAYFHIELDSHDIIFANGAPSETFVDDNSRGMFHNAAEYAALYPEAASAPAVYCAPRVEQGAELEAIRTRLATIAGVAQPLFSEGALRGYLDAVSRTEITGWAQTEGSAKPVQLQILDRGVVLGTVTPDAMRSDLGAQVGFTFVIPGGLSPFERHVIEARRASDHARLGNSPWVLDQTMSAPSLLKHVAPATDSVLEGYVDIVTRERIGGWAWTPEAPEQPVALQILDNGQLIAVTVANGHRPDVAVTGRGLRCGFDVLLPEGLSPFTRHVIEVRRENDGVLLGAPVVIEAVTVLDEEAEKAVSRLLVSASEAEDEERVLSFLLGQVDRLTRQRAERAGGTSTKQALHARRRLGHEISEEVTRPRALVIDGLRPDAHRDAGSCALLSHMQGLVALGYDVSFVAADEMSRKECLTDAPDITVLAAPFYASVEDVLRKHGDQFAIVYLHREEIASRYIPLTRRFQRQANVIFSMADLHFLRMARQAVVLQSPELAAKARMMKQAEYAAIRQADAVLVHSPEEAEMLRREMPGASVHVVPWGVKGSVAPTPLSERKDVVFLGNYSHAPNVDAVRWLVEEIVPRVRAADPAIRFVLAGSNMTQAVKELVCEGVSVVGHVPDLDALFGAARLSVAPLRFGAGIKGKVLESLVRGVPCVMTSVAAEGLELDETLSGLVADSADDFARLVVNAYNASEILSPACRQLMERYDVSCVNAALQIVLESFGGLPMSRAG